MRVVSLIAFVIAGVSAQIEQASVVLPTNGRFAYKDPKKFAAMTEVERQEYRNAFNELNHFAGVDFFKTTLRPNGEDGLGVRENNVNPGQETHAYAEPNKDCPTMCYHEDEQIAEMEAYIKQLDDRYYEIRKGVVGLAHTHGVEDG